MPSFFHSDLLASKIGSATFCCPFFWKRTAKSREPFFVLQKDVKKTPKRCQKVSNLFWTPKGSRAKKSPKSRGTCVHLSSTVLPRLIIVERIFTCFLMKNDLVRFCVFTILLTFYYTRKKWRLRRHFCSLRLPCKLPIKLGWPQNSTKMSGGAR